MENNIQFSDKKNENDDCVALSMEKTKLYILVAAFSLFNPVLLYGLTISHGGDIGMGIIKFFFHFLFFIPGIVIGIVPRVDIFLKSKLLSIVFLVNIIGSFFVIFPDNMEWLVSFVISVLFNLLGFLFGIAICYLLEKIILNKKKDELNNVKFSELEKRKDKKIYTLLKFIRFFIFYLVISFFILLISGSNADGAGLFLFDFYFSGAFFAFALVISLVMFIKKKSNGVKYVYINKIFSILLLISQIAMYILNWFCAEYNSRDDVLWVTSLFSRIIFAIFVIIFLFNIRSAREDEMEQKELEDLENPKKPILRKVIELFLFAVVIAIVVSLSPEILNLGIYGSYIFCGVIAIIIFIFSKLYFFAIRKFSKGISILTTIILSLVLVIISYFAIHSKKETLENLYIKNISDDITINFPDSSASKNNISVKKEVNSDKNPINIFMMEFKKSDYLVKTEIGTTQYFFKDKIEKFPAYYEKGELVRVGGMTDDQYNIIKNSELFSIDSNKRIFEVRNVNSEIGKKGVDILKRESVLPEIVDYFSNNESEWIKDDTFYFYQLVNKYEMKNTDGSISLVDLRVLLDQKNSLIKEITYNKGGTWYRIVFQYKKIENISSIKAFSRDYIKVEDM